MSSSNLTGDLTGRTALVTGATGGIGLWTAVGLARMGAELTIVGRSRERAEAAARFVAERSSRPPPAIELADFASLREVRQLAGRVRERLPVLHLLVNNAGLMVPRREVTVDGYESTFAINHLAPFLLTNLLLPSLQAGAPSRIVTLASTAHQRGRIDFDDLMAKRRYGAMGVYSNSKLANILFTLELSRRLAGTGVVANSVHPGVVATGFGAVGGAWGLVWRLARPFLLTAEQGAATTLYVATAPELATVSGKYFARSREVTPTQAARDEAVAARLWRESEALVAAVP